MSAFRFSVPKFTLPALPRRARPLALVSLYGLAAGLAAVAFEVGINRFFNATFLQLAKLPPGVFLAGSFFVIVGTGLISGWLLSSFAPDAAGSGIPQLKLAFWKDFGYVPWKTVWVKFVAGILTVGGGASLGREGPTVHLAGGACSQLAGRLGVAKNGRRQAAAAGAAAGLAAAFNAPLASITFVLEEIIEDLNSPLLGSVIVAAVLGAFTVHALIGRHPAFHLPPIESPGWRGYALTPLAAALAALVGVGFQVAALRLRLVFRRRPAWKAIPAWTRPAIGAVVTWAIGAAIFLPTGHLGIFSLGYDDLTNCLNDKMTWELAAVLLGGKFVATVAGYGTGGCGGIFAPNLFLGAMCGAALAGAARAIGWKLSVDDHALLTVVAMSACLGAVVRAPLTSILIVFEMTHEFSLVPALMAGGLISQAVSRAFLEHNFYEQALADDGHVLRTVMPPRDLRGWRNYPVSAIANFEPVVLRAPADLEPTRLREILEAHPYKRFPVQHDPPPDADGTAPAIPLVTDPPKVRPPAAILSRHEALAALDEGRPITVREAAVCLRGESIHEAQTGLIASDDGMTLILDRPGGVVVGLMTLHDLLRAQETLAQAADL